MSTLAATGDFDYSETAKPIYSSTPLASPPDGGEAFPLAMHGGIHEYQHWQVGMSLRDYFAGKAMAMDLDTGGTVADAECELGLPPKTYDYKTHWPLLAAKRAYAYADAMIAARSA